MFNKFLLVSAGIIAAASMASNAANALLIDNFTEAAMAIAISGPEAAGGTDKVVTLLDNAGAGAAASIVGGYRDLTTTLVVSPSLRRKTKSDAAALPGEFSHSQDTGVASNSLITWNGLSGAGLGADFTDGGDSVQFLIIVNYSDANIGWRITLSDGAATASHSFSSAKITSPESIYIKFSEADFAGINFTSIQRMSFMANVNNVKTVDTAIALIETVGVPEPASLTLLGAGIMGLGAIKRRRKA